MKKISAAVIFLLVHAIAALAQGEIRVNPTNVMVYSRGSTTVFLTFSNLGNYRPAQTFWCDDLRPATPAVGCICAPGTIYGTLPSRYDVLRRSGNNAYTDIVSVPTSVARRAYLAAARGDGKVTNGNLSWRAVALGRAGQYVGEAEKRKFQLTRSP
jgi:hypothetical protein